MIKLFIIAILLNLPLFAVPSKKQRFIPFSPVYLTIIKEVFSIDTSFLKDSANGILKLSLGDASYSLGPLTLTKRQGIDYGCQLLWINYEYGINKIPYQFIKYLSIDFLYNNILKMALFLKLDWYPTQVKKNFFLYHLLRFYVSLMGKRFLEKIMDKTIDSYCQDEEEDNNYLYESCPDLLY